METSLVNGNIVMNTNRSCKSPQAAQPSPERLRRVGGQTAVGTIGRQLGAQLRLPGDVIGRQLRPRHLIAWPRRVDWLGATHWRTGMPGGATSPATATWTSMCASLAALQNSSASINEAR